MAYHYTVPPPGYVPYDYTTSSSSSPGPDDRYNLYPRARTFHTPAPAARAGSGHKRAVSYSTSPRHAEWHAAPGGYPPPPYYPTTPSYHYSPGAQYEYASAQDPHTPSPKGRPHHHHHHHHHTESSGTPLKRHSSRSHKTRVYVPVDDAPDRVLDSSADEPLYAYIEPRTPTAGRKRSNTTDSKKPMRKTETYFFSHSTAPHHDDRDDFVDTPRRSRAHTRRPSTATPPKSKGKTSKTATPDAKLPPAAATSPREATAADAARHRIPAGYSLKNWDPDEGPFLLLGSVFDGNSLGKWIYDWTYFHHGARSPLNDVAGELWLLLIKFAGKVQRAEEALPRLRLRRDERACLDAYALRGRRLWARVQDLLRSCEEFMWRGARREGSSGGSGKGKVVMGEKSGVEFVATIFGRDRELPRTEKIMSGIRLFNLRFDHDCEDLLRRPRSK